VEIAQRRLGGGGDDHDAAQEVRPLGLEEAQDLEAVQLREHEVKDDGVVVVAAQARDRLRAVGGGFGGESVAVQERREQAADGRIVVDEKNHSGVRIYRTRGAARLSVSVHSSA